MTSLRLGRDDFRETFLAVVGGRGADGALQLDDVDVALRGLSLARGVVLQQPATRLAAFLDEVGADQRDEQRVVGHLDGAIREDHGDVRGLGLAQHGFPAGFDDGRERDHVDALRDERAQRLDLVLLLLLGVRELERDAGFRGGVLHRFRVRRAPLAFGADLAEAEHDGFRGAIARGFVGAARAGGENRGEHRGAREREQ
jgi:hypothetical protein